MNKPKAVSSKSPMMRIVDKTDVSTVLEKRIIYTVSLSESKFVDVMNVIEQCLFYVMQSEDDKMVFDSYGNMNSDDINWTDDAVDEKEIVAFVKSEIKRTAELDALMD